METISVHEEVLHVDPLKDGPNLGPEGMEDRRPTAVGEPLSLLGGTLGSPSPTASGRGSVGQESWAQRCKGP